MAITKKTFALALTVISIMIVVAVLCVSCYRYGRGACRLLGGEEIVILQSSDNDALNAARTGLMDEIAKCCGKYGISFRSAHGDPQLAMQIATTFAKREPKVIVAIGTLAAQAAHSSARNVPVIFSAVIDPVGAGLVHSLHNGEDSRITGVSDFFDVTEQLHIFKAALPSIATVGIVYNPIEQNAVYSLERVNLAAKELGIEVRALPVADSGEIQHLTRKLCRGTDAILILPDNMMDSELHSVASAAHALGKPVLSSYIDGVKNGAIIAVGVDMRTIGHATGKVIKKVVVDGEKPGLIPIEVPGKIITKVRRTSSSMEH